MSHQTSTRWQRFVETARSRIVLPDISSPEECLERGLAEITPGTGQTVVHGPWHDHREDGFDQLFKNVPIAPDAFTVGGGSRFPLPETPLPRNACVAIVAHARLETARTEGGTPTNASRWTANGVELRYVATLENDRGDQLRVPEQYALLATRRICIEQTVPHSAYIDVTGPRGFDESALEAAISGDEELSADWEGASDTYVAGWGRAGEDHDGIGPPVPSRLSENPADEHPVQDLDVVLAYAPDQRMEDRTHLFGIPFDLKNRVKDHNAILNECIPKLVRGTVDLSLIEGAALSPYSEVYALSPHNAVLVLDPHDSQSRLNEMGRKAIERRFAEGPKDMDVLVVTGIERLIARLGARTVARTVLQWVSGTTPPETRQPAVLLVIPVPSTGEVPVPWTRPALP